LIVLDRRGIVGSSTTGERAQPYRNADATRIPPHAPRILSSPSAAPPGASRRSAGSAGVNERINTHVAERAAYANTASRPTPCARVLRDNTRRLARGRSNVCTLTRVIKIAELPFRCSCYGCKCRCRHCRRCRRRRHQRTTSARDSRPSISPSPAPLPGIITGRSACSRAATRFGGFLH